MTAPKLQFRVAVPADAAELGRFMARNFLAAYGHCSTPDNVATAVAEHYGEAAQLRQLLDSSRYNLIAFAGEEWVGHAQLHIGINPPEGAGTLPALELSRFYVEEGHHGSGIAQAMMAQLKHEARSRGGASLWLSAWQDAPKAIRFYEKEGFRIAGRLVFMVGDDPKDDWLMVCELG
jgi:GNAT superfamily N-acetyltransferase